MRDAAGVEKLLLELGSGAHYCRVAQIHWVAVEGTKKQKRWSNTFTRVALGHLILVTVS